MPNPLQSHLIAGTAYKSDGTTAFVSCRVMLINYTKGEVLLQISDSQGRYLFDCANFNDYDNGDTMEVFCYGELFSRHVIADLVTATTKEYRFIIDYVFSNDSIGSAVVVDTGLNLIRDWMNGDTVTCPTYIEWNDATGTPAITDTSSDWDTGGSNEQRNIISSQNEVSTVEIEYHSTLTSSQLDGVDITKSGLFNASSNGTLWAQILYGAVNKTTGFGIIETDHITIT